jgi:dimethylaniline monooxygenase (N-oxide forming)
MHTTADSGTSSARPSHVDCIVIGAGPSGLVVLKELKEQGLSVLGFEAQAQLGGVFRSSYDFLRLVTSSNHVFFSSLPHGDESNPVIWSRVAYLDYLTRFANHFGLMPHIRFSTRVTDVRRDDGALYTVTTDDGARYTCTNLVVCSGVHTVPKQFTAPGLATFTGEVMHSAKLRDGKSLAGRRVLIVGLGESASDISLEVSKHAAATCISSRGGPGFVIPRHFGGTVTDLDTNRCYHSLPYQVFDSWPVRFKVWLEGFYATKTDDHRVLEKTREFNRTNGRPWKMRTSTKSTSFVEAILYHGAEYRGAIDRIEGDRVIFEDGSEFQCDLILDCTGFRLTFPFLEGLPGQVARRVEKPRSLYLRMFIPEVGPSLSFVGFLRPAVGAIPPISELQARYLALLFTGQRSLPPMAEMQADIAWHDSQDHYDKVPWLSDYIRFLDGTARQIGCLPPMTRLFFTDPRLWWKTMFATLSGVQYRLAGPGQDYATARATLLKMPTMPAPVLLTELLIKLACEAYACLPGASFGMAHRPAKVVPAVMNKATMTSE